MCADPSNDDPPHKSKLKPDGGDPHKKGAPDAKLIHWLSYLTHRRVYYLSFLMMDQEYIEFGESMLRLMEIFHR